MFHIWLIWITDKLRDSSVITWVHKEYGGLALLGLDKIYTTGCFCSTFGRWAVVTWNQEFHVYSLNSYSLQNEKNSKPKPGVIRRWRFLLLAKSLAMMLAKRFLRRVWQYCFSRRDSCEELGNTASCEEILAKSFLRRVGLYCFLRRDSCEEWVNTATSEEIPAKRFLQRDLVFLSRFRCAHYADCLIAILYWWRSLYRVTVEWSLPLEVWHGAEKWWLDDMYFFIHLPANQVCARLLASPVSTLLTAIYVRPFMTIYFEMRYANCNRQHFNTGRDEWYFGGFWRYVGQHLPTRDGC